MGRKLYLLESRKMEKYDTFEFGVWKGKPIEWQVLDVGSGLLCISKYCLTQRMFDEESNDWKISELRKWLNSDFYNKSFNSEEKSFLIPYSYYGDKVTLLSEAEVHKCFSSGIKRIARSRNGNKENWWLRSHNKYSRRTAYAISVGGFTCNGDIEDVSVSVRPVICLKKEVENFLDPEEV